MRGLLLFFTWRPPQAREITNLNTKRPQDVTCIAERERAEWWCVSLDKTPRLCSTLFFYRFCYRKLEIAVHHILKAMSCYVYRSSEGYRLSPEFFPECLAHPITYIRSRTQLKCHRVVRPHCTWADELNIEGAVLLIAGVCMYVDI